MSIYNMLFGAMIVGTLAIPAHAKVTSAKQVLKQNNALVKAVTHGSTLSKKFRPIYFSGKDRVFLGSRRGNDCNVNIASPQAVRMGNVNTVVSARDITVICR